MLACFLRDVCRDMPTNQAREASNGTARAPRPNRRIDQQRPALVPYGQTMTGWATTTGAARNVVTVVTGRKVTIG